VVDWYRTVGFLLILDNKLTRTKNLANIIYMIKSQHQIGTTTRITQSSLSIAKCVASFWSSIVVLSWYFCSPFKEEDTSKDNNIATGPSEHSINSKTINMSITSNHIHQSTSMMYSILLKLKLSAERSQYTEQMEIWKHYSMSMLNLNYS